MKLVIALLLATSAQAIKVRQSSSFVDDYSVAELESVHASRVEALT